MEIRSELCQGHARCFAVSPEVYDIDDDGYISTSSGEVPAVLESKARAGAQACPEKVIALA
jgi:ferredoxin